ncbi:MAG: DUF4440 domain-containing protein, partial [Burkholderiaceae bacterium]|nr:DUF4440 domain-containing protein [Burkholderiaceae bacterium]
WAGKDMNGYLGAYGREFDPPGSQSRKAWEEERRARIVGKSRINVKIENLSVAVAGTKATAKFRQAYSADSLHVSSRKTLEMVKAGDRWVIIKESTGA